MTNSIFFRGVAQPPTSYAILCHGTSWGNPKMPATQRSSGVSLNTTANWDDHMDLPRNEHVSNSTPFSNRQYREKCWESIGIGSGSIWQTCIFRFQSHSVPSLCHMWIPSFPGVELDNSFIWHDIYIYILHIYLCVYIYNYIYALSPSLCIYIICFFFSHVINHVLFESKYPLVI